MIKKRTLLFTLVVLASTLLQAQGLFTIQLGNFSNATKNQFKTVESMGVVYARPIGDGFSQVCLGLYNGQDIAERVRTQVLVNGYPKAYLIPVFTQQTTDVPVVQLGMYDPKKAMNWADIFALGSPYLVLHEGNALKVVLSDFKSVDEARQKQNQAREAGFKDAFLKTINPVYLHPVGNFEAEGFKRPLIPLTLDKRPTAQEVNNTPASNTSVSVPTKTDTPYTPSTDTPTYYDNSGDSRVSNMTRKGGYDAAGYNKVSLALPAIRSNVKRNSVFELQKFLKSQNVYSGSLDGYYGAGTASAWQHYKSIDDTYPSLAKKSAYFIDANVTQLQAAIENIHQERTTLARINHPLAKAYLAYWELESRGPGNQVNTLMSEALKEAFKGKVRSQIKPAFDPTAQYHYPDDIQFISHLAHLHALGNIPIPCWMEAKHTKALIMAFEQFAASDVSLPFTPGCSPTQDWEEVRVMMHVVQELGGMQSSQASGIPTTALLLNPDALPDEANKALEGWHSDLWTRMDKLASRNIQNRSLVEALRGSYFQSYVRLEDYFMDKGFRPPAAKGLALGVLENLCAPYLDGLAK